MHASTRLVSAFLVVSCFATPACVDTTALQIREGSLDLNPKLRADMAASDQMANGSYFADGECPGQSTSHECRYVTPVRGSMIDAGNPSFISRLRRAPFLWVASDGFVQLSYEFVGSNMSIVERDDPGNVIASDATIGTCHAFPAYDPDTRQVIPEFSNASIADALTFAQQFSVTLKSCIESSSPNTISQTLRRIDMNCSDASVRSLVGSNVPPNPQNPPFCLVNLHGGQLMTDVSYSVAPGAAPGIDLDDLWPGVDNSPRQLLPNLKTVPVDGKRTISRRMLRTGETVQNDDGSTTHWFTWQVGLSDGDWNENFSPNIFVTRARVRKGTIAAGVYLPLESFKAGIVRCETVVPGSNNTEFDILMCNPNASDVLRVTPGYAFEAIKQARIGNSDRILWEARVRTPPNTLGASDLFLELDLSADSPVGSSGSGLMAAPATRDLGMLRTGLTPDTQDGFMLQSLGAASVRVESITLQGPDAGGFGTPQIIQRGSSVTTPFVVSRGSPAEIRLQPNFQLIGRKTAQLLVSYRGIRNAPGSIGMGLAAQVASPSVIPFPENLNFNAVPGPTGHAQALRAALLINGGAVTFRRTGTSIVGPQADSFRVLRGEFGTGASDLTQPQTIGPGESELYRLAFYPNTSGDSRATLLIDTNEGQVSVNLFGFCQEGCFRPPELTAEEPPRLPFPVHEGPLVFPKLKVKPGGLGKDKRLRRESDQ
ncbi:MAG: hypothetical protein OEQ74_00510 [Gammaproteobacteria bacterium]|nr:hypothetical protein [Gammaproteobacteria bacterium]